MKLKNILNRLLLRSHSFPSHTYMVKQSNSLLVQLQARENVIKLMAKLIDDLEPQNDGKTVWGLIKLKLLTEHNIDVG